VAQVIFKSNILSLCFNGHFPGEPGLTGVYWSKGWWRRWQLDYWSYKSCKALVKSSPPTNQHPVFLQAGCPSWQYPWFYQRNSFLQQVMMLWNQQCQSIEGKISHFTDLLTLTSPGVFQLLSLTTNSSWCYLGEGCHASHHPSDASTPKSNIVPVYNIILQLNYSSTVFHTILQRTRFLGCLEIFSLQYKTVAATIATNCSCNTVLYFTLRNLHTFILCS